MSVNVNMKEIVSICAQRGFIFQGSDIYGGLANTWDYGPLGVELKKNIKKMWWKNFIQRPKFNVGIDSAILMNPKVWEASGHVGGFNDPQIDCKVCKSRFRADNLIENYYLKNGKEVVVDGWSKEKMTDFIDNHDIKCLTCGNKDFTEIRDFNLMFKTSQGVVDESARDIYLRPETAQGIFVNFSKVQRTSRQKLPFGIGQIGKSFRNEITPGNFIFRTREFEQMELEFFCKPDEDLKWYEYWKKECMDFLLNIGVREDNLRFRDHEEDELSHYSNATSDIEFKFPFGWGELWGIADRTDYDLKQHIDHSGKNLKYHDPYTNKKLIPYCIEPSVGVDRLFLAILVDAMEEEELENGKTRNLMRLNPELAPVKAAVFPLTKKLADEAEEVYNKIRDDFNAVFDTSGSIGKRYRRHDEVGTPFCITYDYDSRDDNQVTIRDRDTMEQVRIDIDKVKDYVLDRITLD
ncbi:MAG: glycine--tRNA ligase [Bacillota bacterium]